MFVIRISKGLLCVILQELSYIMWYMHGRIRIITLNEEEEKLCIEWYVAME